MNELTQNPNAVKRAIIYVRVSTDEQTKGYSLKTQIEGCENYAKELGYSVVATFQEDYTGTVLDRPTLNEMRQFIVDDTGIDAMIVYDLDRMARKSVHQMILEEELLRLGVIVEYVIGRYEDSDEGRLQKQIRASIAEYEKAKILERSKRGKRGKAKSGFVIVGSRPPYGYQSLSEPHKTWLVIDEDEAKVVKMVYDWFLIGNGDEKPLSIRAISLKLTELGIPTRGDKVKHVAKKFGHGVWQAAMVTHILKNETYTGTWHFGKTKMVNDGKESTRKLKSKRGLGKQTSRSKDEWISVPVPAIIDLITFKLAQNRFELNKTHACGPKPEHQYLMGKRLKCNRCNYGYRGQYRRNGNWYYLCNGKRQVVSRCDMPSFSGRLIDETVWDWVKNRLLNTDNLTNGLNYYQEEQDKTSTRCTAMLTTIDEQLATGHKQLDRLIDLYISGDIPKDHYALRKTKFEESIAKLEEERKEVSKQLLPSQLAPELIKQLREYFDKIRDRLDDASFETKRRLIDLLDVNGKLDIENNERVIYIKCLISPQQRLQMPTSHSLNTGETPTLRCGCPKMARSP
jgi:site-specific DNA recombinase